MLKKPFTFGSITLPSNIFCAPLAGCSDFPFRKMTAKYKPGLSYCEMVKMEALIRNDEGTLRMLDFDASMHPIGAQLCGSKKELAGPCARLLEDKGFDVIDLNCGCPVDKVTKDGSGSGLLKQIDTVGEIIAAMVAAVKIPVTLKIRAGWDAQHIITEALTRIAEEAGATALCIHGRTRAQGYTGPANWDFITQCKRAAKKMLIIGNGDVFDPLAAKAMFETTGCDAILLARGIMGKPWLIDDIYHCLSHQDIPHRSFAYCKSILIEHLDHILTYQEPKKALLDFRRVGCWFLKGGKGMRHLRDALNHSSGLLEAKNMIDNYPWDENDCTECDLQLSSDNEENSSCKS